MSSVLPLRKARIDQVVLKKLWMIDRLLHDVCNEDPMFLKSLYMQTKGVKWVDGKEIMREWTIILSNKVFAMRP